MKKKKREKKEQLRVLQKRIGFVSGLSFFHICDRVSVSLAPWGGGRRGSSLACVPEETLSGGMCFFFFLSPPSSFTNLLLRAAADAGILRAFSIDRWDLEKEVWEELLLGVFGGFFSASSHGDAQNLRMFTPFKIMQMTCQKSLFTHIRGMYSWDDAKLLPEDDSYLTPPPPQLS